MTLYTTYNSTISEMTITDFGYVVGNKWVSAVSPKMSGTPFVLVEICGSNSRNRKTTFVVNPENRSSVATLFGNWVVMHDNGPVRFVEEAAEAFIMEMAKVSE